MNANEKLELLKKQEVILKELIKGLENQKERLDIEATEITNFLRFISKFILQLNNKFNNSFKI